MWKILLVLLTSLLCGKETALLEIGGTKVSVEIANSPEETRTGLSGRDQLPEGAGMLFIYNRPQKVSFWMKDTRFPLSVGFFDETQVLFQIEDMFPPEKGNNKLPIYTSAKLSLYALEVPRGWFQKNSIKPGMKFKLSQIESIR